MPGLVLALLLGVIVYLASASVVWALVTFVVSVVVLDARLGARRWF